jgi:hypothetical protein
MEIVCQKCGNLGLLCCDIIICTNEKCKHEWGYDLDENIENDNKTN